MNPKKVVVKEHSQNNGLRRQLPAPQSEDANNGHLHPIPSAHPALVLRIASFPIPPRSIAYMSERKLAQKGYRCSVRNSLIMKARGINSWPITKN
jgi:hypothetical protein